LPIVKLVAEGIGPFDRLELDLSDGNGNPHLGPHILAGVNGSGKSTILRIIGWLLDPGNRGFNSAEWEHFTTGQSARAIATFPGSDGLYAIASNPGSKWSWSETVDRGVDLLIRGSDAAREFNIAGYTPSKALRYIEQPSLTATLTNPDHNALSFEATIQNDAIQAWLLGLYSKRAIANEKRQPTQQYTLSLERFESALKLLYDEEVKFDVEIEPNFQPRLRVAGQNLNFSQMPDGIRGTVGWIADFMMRQDRVNRGKNLGDKRPGILLLDEVDAHLHPLWQRKLLPAVRKALPDVQIVVTSHSPFVISSCPGSRVHVLEVDAKGRAHNRPPVDSPIGESVMTTLKEIFGVDSRFDIQTEAELNEWNALKKLEATGKLKQEQRQRLLALTKELAERSEELRALVAGPMSVPKSVLEALLAEV